MKQYLLDLASNPVNWAIAVIFLLQVYKAIKPSLPISVTEKADKVAAFLQWAIPSCYQVVESLEKQNLISGSSKFPVFLDKLIEEGNKQGINLSIVDIQKAKTVVSAIAATDKIPPAFNQVNETRPTTNPIPCVPVTK